MIDIKIFHSNVLKRHWYLLYWLHYYKKFDDCKNIHSVNTLYLVVRSATWYFKEKYGEKYLILDLIEKCEEVFSGVKSEIETLNSGKELFYEKNYAKIRVNTDDNIPLTKN